MTGFARFVFASTLLIATASFGLGFFVLVSLDYSQGLGGAFNQVWCGAMTCPK